MKRRNKHDFISTLVQTLKGLLLLLVSSISYISTGQVLEYHTEIEAKPESLVTERTFLIQINSRDMDWASDVTIPYHEGDKVELLDAEIVDVRGKALRSIGKKEVTTRNDVSEGSFFQDRWVQEFRLKWNTYPYRIKYRYRVTTKKFIYLIRWSPATLASAETESSLTIIHPVSYQVRIFQSGEIKSDSIRERGSIKRRWTFQGSVASSTETFAPPYEDLLPCVIAAPARFSYGVEGSLESWKSYGEWQYNLNLDANDLPQIEKFKVEEIKTKSPDKVAQMRELYHYVQDNTRYINVSLDVGGFKSYPASYVSSRKYGDCKALSVFMQSLLATAGISSNTVNINSDDNPEKLHLGMPGPQFNHMILCVPVGKDTIWLENTANHVPFGYLGTSTQNRHALVIHPGGSKMVRTPALTSEQVKCSRTYEYTQGPTDDKIGGRATWELRGDDFERFTSLKANYSQDDIAKAIQRSLPRSDFRLLSWAFRQENRDSPVVHLDLELEVTNAIRTVGAMRMIRTTPIPFPELENPLKRKTLLRLNYPIHEESSHVFLITKIESQVVTLPKDISLTSEFGSYSARFTKEAQKLSVSRNMLLLKQDVPLTKYADFYRFIQSIKDAERNASMILEPKP